MNSFEVRMKQRRRQTPRNKSWVCLENTCFVGSWFFPPVYKRRLRTLRTSWRSKSDQLEPIGIVPPAANPIVSGLCVVVLGVILPTLCAQNQCETPTKHHPQCSAVQAFFRFFLTFASNSFISCIPLTGLIRFQLRTKIVSVLSQNNFSVPFVCACLVDNFLKSASNSSKQVIRHVFIETISLKWNLALFLWNQNSRFTFLPQMYIFWQEWDVCSLASAFYLWAAP